MYDSCTVAFHEAGHSVVSVLLGQQSTGVSIIPDGESLGTSSYDLDLPDGFDEWHDDFEAILDTHIRILYAGMIAEEILHDGKFDEAGCEGDFDLIAELAMRLDANVDELLDRIHHEVMTALKENWGMVERLAQRLLDKRELTGEEVMKMLAPH